MARADSTLWWLSILGVCCILVACVPGVPWRLARRDATFGKHFPYDRHYSLLSVGSLENRAVAWSELASRTCQRHFEMAKPSKYEKLGNELETSSKKDHPLLGGSYFGCELWETCKDHAAARCTAYLDFKSTGRFCSALLLFGCCFSALATICQTREGVAMPIKLLPAAQQMTLAMTLMGWLFSTMGTLVWIRRSGSLIVYLQQTGYYPFPTVAVGAILALTGCFFLSITVLCALARSRSFTWDFLSA